MKIFFLNRMNGVYWFQKFTFDLSKRSTKNFVPKKPFLRHIWRKKVSSLKGTWQWGGFSGVFAEIGSSWVPYTTFLAVPILASNSRRYSYSKNDSPLSPIRGVANSPYRWCRESPTPRIVEWASMTPHITDTLSWRLPASPIRRVGYLKENSLYRWYGESSTPRTSDTVSRRLPVSLSRRVADSAYHRYGESTTPRIVESGSRRLRVSVIRGVAIRKKN